MKPRDSLALASLVISYGVDVIREAVDRADRGVDLLAVAAQHPELDELELAVAVQHPELDELEGDEYAARLALLTGDAAGHLEGRL